MTRPFLAGGLVLDSLGATLSNSSRMCLFSVTSGFIIVQAAFVLCRELPSFVLLFALGEFVLFMISAPITTIILMSVPSQLRPLAFSVQTISIHLFGDVPSPPLAGWIHDNLFHEDDKVRQLLVLDCSFGGELRLVCHAFHVHSLLGLKQ